MALTANVIYEIQSGATAANVNGGGFDKSQTAGMLTDLTTDADTANTSAPVLSSASYNFVAGDVGHWVYIAAGTNWIVGWYKIASVATNKATLSAAIGSTSVRIVSDERFIANTATGCASVGTPTNGTFTIDYTQGTTAILALTDGASTDASLVLTSATGGFTPVMVGNLVHITAGTNATTGWYCITAYTNTNTVTIDRDCTAGVTTMSAATFKVGGALSLANSDDDSVFELLTNSTTAASKYFIKGSATYTLTSTVTMAADGNSAWRGVLEGYASVRGDRPTGSTRPTIATGSLVFTIAGAYTDWHSIIFTGTNTSVVASGSGTVAFFNCKFVNTSTTANRAGLNISGSGQKAINCEAISYRGYALYTGSVNVLIAGGYYHDSAVGIVVAISSGACNIHGNIVASNVTAAIQNLTTAMSNGIIMGNTLYGAENKIGIGLDHLTGSRLVTFMNNIIYGFTTGVTHPDVNFNYTTDWNDYYNNTNDLSAASHWGKGTNDLAVDPAFTSVQQRTGTTATTSGSALTQSGATFTTWGVTAGTHYLHLVSGTGVTVGKYGIASVDSETQITLDIAPGTDATADKTWAIVTGLNWAVGTSLKALGTPGAFPGSSTTGYMDIGAAQRQEAGGSYAGSGNLHHIGTGFIRG